MSEQVSLFCGCTYVRIGPKWHQAVACPDHVFDFMPLDDVPNRKPGHSATEEVR
jgi:hypothetical protein